MALTDDEFNRLIADAEKTNAERDADERRLGFTPECEQSLEIRLSTIEAALAAGIRIADVSCLAEALAMLRSVRRDRAWEPVSRG